MDKNKIEKILAGHDSTILSFSDRGPWGDASYRGNCSGYIQGFLIWKYKAKKLAELFAGGGTGYDIAHDMGVSYVGADLNPVPARPGMLCINAVTDDVPDGFCDADLIFMHPPYGAEIKIPYAGNMYPDPTGELSVADLGQMPWDKFMSELNAVVMKYYAAMASGAHMGILMGDVRRGGFHSMLADIVKPGELTQLIVKAQHNTVSGNRAYSSKNFVPIAHEFLMVIKKPGGYVIAYRLPAEHRMDIRDSQAATWRDVVRTALEAAGGQATLDAIYREVDGHEKAKHNPHWREKVRQTLQINPVFTATGRGVWALAS